MVGCKTIVIFEAEQNLAKTQVKMHTLRTAYNIFYIYILNYHRCSNYNNNAYKTRGRHNDSLHFSVQHLLQILGFKRSFLEKDKDVDCFILFIIYFVLQKTKH